MSELVPSRHGGTVWRTLTKAEQRQAALAYAEAGTFRAVGERFGISPERARQLHAKQWRLWRRCMTRERQRWTAEDVWRETELYRGKWWIRYDLWDDETWGSGSPPPRRKSSVKNYVPRPTWRTRREVGMVDLGLGDAPAALGLAEEMGITARTLDLQFNGDVAPAERRVGFILMAFEFGDVNERVNYISNGATNKEIIAILKEQLLRLQTAERHRRGEFAGTPTPRADVLAGLDAIAEVQKG